MKKLFLLTATFCFFSTNTIASEQNFQLHGFVSQGLIDVDGSNFVNDDGALSTELTELGLNASYQLNSSFRLAGQMVYLDGGNRYNDGVRVDYALLDWSAYTNENWQINLYLGRYKNYHWLYSSTRDIPFTRPSIILPQSVYFDGFRDIAVGADGIAVKVNYSSDGLGYFDFNFSTGVSSISDKQTKIILSDFALGDMKHTYDLQMSLYWQPFLSPWRFGLALLDSDFEYDAASQGDAFIDATITLRRYFANVLYEGESWEFSSEVFQERFIFDDFYYDGFTQDLIGQGIYVQSRYKVNNELNLLLRYERFYANKDDKNGHNLESNSQGLVPSYFGYQHDATIGFSYDLAANFRMQFEYHYINGTARLTPVVLPDPQINDSKNWQLWAVQLMYWF
ncbi:MAG: hypothetical protein QNK36_01655 [Colwellia sp.]|nr:hypothetical protein [Colwellia sp.]